MKTKATQTKNPKKKLVHTVSNISYHTLLASIMLLIISLAMRVELLFYISLIGSLIGIIGTPLGSDYCPDKD